MKLKTKIVALASTAAIFVGAAFGVGLSLGKASAEEWTSTVTEWQWEEDVLLILQGLIKGILNSDLFQLDEGIQKVLSEELNRQFCRIEH